MLLYCDDHPAIYSDEHTGGVFSQLYAHNELEVLLGTDLICSSNWLSLLPGTWKIEVESLDGIVHRCLAFVWMTKYGTKGFVVLPEDEMAVEQAIENMVNKPSVV